MPTEPLSARDFNTLLKEKKFADVMLISWVTIEHIVNTLFLGEFGLLTVKGNEPLYNADDPRVKFLFEKLNFEDKYKFLKERGLFTEKEKESISKFQSRRNKLFHASADENFFLEFNNQEERASLIGLADEALRSAVISYKRYKSVH